MPVTIYTDNVHASNVATSEDTVNKDAEAGHLLAAMHQVAIYAAAGSSVSYQHVKGHSGHPWNELADWAAGPSSWRFPSTPLPYLNIGLDNIKALFWCTQALLEPDAFPAIHNGRMIIDLGDEALLPTDLATTAKYQEAPNEDRAFEFNIGQANVLSLLPDQSEETGDAIDTTRTDHLCDIMHEQGLLFMGVQESRMKKKGVRRHRGVFAISSGADPAGGHGVELWINSTSAAISIDRKDVFINPKNTNVLCSSPTLMIVLVQCLDLLLAIVVGHAPNTGRGKKAIEAWWDKLHEFHSRIPLKAVKVACIDGNCRLGSISGPGVGPYQPQLEDAGGARMRAFLAAWALWAPQTFESSTSPGPSHTWQNDLMGCHRIDYVLADTRAQAYAWPRHDLDISGGAQDHWMVQAQIRGKAATNDTVAQRRRPICDRNLLMHQPHAAILDMAMRQCPSVQWRVHADDHNAIQACWQRSVLAALAPLRKMRPRKSWISKEAFDAAAHRASCRAHFTQHLRR